MGSCVNAPMIAVADYSGPDVRSFSYTYYEDLTPEDAVSIMEDLKAGKKPRVSACRVCWCALCTCAWPRACALMCQYAECFWLCRCNAGMCLYIACPEQVLDM